MFVCLQNKFIFLNRTSWWQCGLRAVATQSIKSPFMRSWLRITAIFHNVCLFAKKIIFLNRVSWWQCGRQVQSIKSPFICPTSYLVQNNSYIPKFSLFAKKKKNSFYRGSGLKAEVCQPLSPTSWEIGRSTCFASARLGQWLSMTVVATQQKPIYPPNFTLGSE